MLIYKFVVVFGGVVEKRKHNEMEERWLFSENVIGILCCSAFCEEVLCLLLKA